jgi:hypothetical protein
VIVTAQEGPQANQAPEPHLPSEALALGGGAASSKAAPKLYMSEVPEPAVLDEMVRLCLMELRVGAAYCYDLEAAC